MVVCAGYPHDVEYDKLDAVSLITDLEHGGFKPAWNQSSPTESVLSLFVVSVGTPV
jgi:hypothetical protein